MQTRTKVLIGIAVAVVLGLAAFLAVRNQRDRGIEVRTEVIERRDLVEIVTASGNIRARRTVDTRLGSRNCRGEMLTPIQRGSPCCATIRLPAAQAS